VVLSGPGGPVVAHETEARGVVARIGVGDHEVTSGLADR
jgi:hypothetical protein